MNLFHRTDYAFQRDHYREVGLIRLFPEGFHLLFCGCSLSREKNSSFRRVQVMLENAKSHEWISYGIVTIAVIIVVICIFWLSAS